MTNKKTETETETETVFWSKHLAKKYFTFFYFFSIYTGIAALY